jgi:hypothetical protein
VSNVAGFLLLFAWVALIIFLFGFLASELGVRAPSGDLAWAQWPLAVVALMGGRTTVHGVLRDGGWRRYVEPMLGLAVTIATIPSLIERMRSIDALSTPSWWTPLGWE